MIEKMILVAKKVGFHKNKRMIKSDKLFNNIHFYFVHIFLLRLFLVKLFQGMALKNKVQTLKYGNKLMIQLLIVY